MGDGSNLERPEFIELPPPRDKDHYWWAAIAVVASCAGFFYWWSYSEDPIEPAAKPWPAGYAALVSCSYTSSLDGTKALDLREDQRAVLYDKTTKDEDGKYAAAEGRWEFDQTTKRYAVTLDGLVTTYSILEPKETSVCILVKGELTAADLTASWFSPKND